LRSPEHFDSLDVLKLEISLDWRVVEVNADRMLLEGAKTRSRGTGVQPSDDGERHGGIARSPASRNADLPRQRRKIRHRVRRDLLGPYDRNCVGNLLGPLLTTAGRDDDFIENEAVLSTCGLCSACR